MLNIDIRNKEAITAFSAPDLVEQHSQYLSLEPLDQSQHPELPCSRDNSSLCRATRSEIEP